MKLREDFTPEGRVYLIGDVADVIPFGRGVIVRPYFKAIFEEELNSWDRLESAWPSPRTYETWERRATERNWQVIEAVEDIARAHEATPSQVAIAWLLRQPAVASVIVGVRTMEQLEDNLGAADLKLSVDELDRLSQSSALPDIYPYVDLRHHAQR